MNRYLMGFLGVAGVMIGLGLVMPAVAQMHKTGSLPTVSVGLLLLGLTLIFSGGGAVVYGVRRLGA